jgi:hypothetical protein
MRSLLLAFLLVAGVTTTAAEERRFAILSLFGDGMLISQWVPSTGARLDPNVKEFIPIVEGIFDKTALLAVHGLLKQRDPKSEPVLLFARERSLYESQARMLDKDGKSVLLLDHLRGLLKGTGATHLILLTKFKNEARIRVEEATVGNGVLEGVGFYIDSSMPILLRESRETATGFLAPFAYFRVELIDIARGEVVKEARIVAATGVSTPNRTAEHAWNALSGAQKIQALQTLIRSETTRVMPALLETTP